MNNHERDLRQAASVFIEDLLNLKSGERLMIYADQGSDYNVAKIIRKSAGQIGAFTEFYEFNADLKLADIVRVLTDKIERGSFDVICELSEQYFYPTAVWKKAKQLGARIYSLGGVSADAFIRCVGKVNHELMFQFGMALRGLMKRAKFIRIFTPKGTDIKLQIRTDRVFKFISVLRRTQKPYVTYPSGIFIPPIRATFMGGQLAFQGIPETIEGRAAIDGCMWPPKEMGRADVPIILKIKNGSLIEIGGSPLKAKILNQWFEGQTKEIQHFCIGFNPGAKSSGSLIEAERVFGHISIGIGKYPFHTDGIIKNPSISLNNEMIEQDGSFIHKELSILQRHLTQDDSQLNRDS